MDELLRPTFECEVFGVEPGTVIELVAAELAARGLPSRRAGHHFMIWMPEGARRTWSPWLHLDVVPGDGGGVALFGRFTPAPSLWTGVVLAYLALAVIAVGGALFAYCQWLVDEHPWGLWLPLGALTCGALLLAVSRTGQSLARAQMAELRAFADGVVARAATR